MCIKTSTSQPRLAYDAIMLAGCEQWDNFIQLPVDGDLDDVNDLAKLSGGVSKPGSWVYEFEDGVPEGLLYKLNFIIAKSARLEALTDTGRKLYGDNWQSPLARALYVSPRQMRYWVSGKTIVPHRVVSKLSRVIYDTISDQQRQHQELEALSRYLDAPSRIWYREA